MITNISHRNHTQSYTLTNIQHFAQLTMARYIEQSKDGEKREASDLLYVYKNITEYIQNIAKYRWNIILIRTRVERKGTFANNLQILKLSGPLQTFTDYHLSKKGMYLCDCIDRWNTHRNIHTQSLGPLFLLPFCEHTSENTKKWVRSSENGRI